MKIHKIAATAFVAAAALAGSAQAALITGSVGITTRPGTTLNVDFGTDFVNFTPDSFNAQVDQGTGTASTLAPIGTIVTYKDFDYSAPFTVVGGNPLWLTDTGSLAFFLTSITDMFENGTAPGAQGLTLFGEGFFTSNVAGFDQTPATWTFQANSTGGAPSFTFASTNAAQPSRVPDGGTSVALLGFSLLGLAGARRKFAKA